MLSAHCSSSPLPVAQRARQHRKIHPRPGTKVQGSWAAVRKGVEQDRAVDPLGHRPVLSKELQDCVNEIAARTLCRLFWKSGTAYVQRVEERIGLEY